MLHRVVNEEFNNLNINTNADTKNFVSISKTLANIESNQADHSTNESTRDINITQSVVDSMRLRFKAMYVKKVTDPSPTAGIDTLLQFTSTACVGCNADEINLRIMYRLSS